MTTQIQLRRDTAANWTSNNPTLAEGELGFELDTNKFKIGNGTDNWNTLSYFSSGGGTGTGPVSLSGVETIYDNEFHSVQAVNLNSTTSLLQIQDGMAGVAIKSVSINNDVPPEGRILIITATGSEYGFINLEDTSATAVYRFAVIGGQTQLIIRTGEYAIFIYSASRWRAFTNKAMSFLDLIPSTSSELAGVISDETGSGSLVFGTSPSITTATLNAPNFGTTQTYTTTGTSNNISITAGVTLFRYTGASTATLSGFSAAGSTPAAGRVLLVINTTANLVTLTNEDANSTAAYRLNLPGAVSMTLGQHQVVTFIYDSTSSRWRASEVGLSASTPAANASTGTIGTAALAARSDHAHPAVAISTGVSGLGANVATFLATPSSANLISAVTDETGSGALVFGTSPTINGQSIGTVQTYSTTGTSNNISVSAGVSIIRYTGAGTATLTGFSAAGATPASGRILVIMNSTSNAVTLSNENASSTAAYRLSLPNSVDMVIGANQVVTLFYDVTSSRWRASSFAATNANTASTVVSRDASGNFSAGTITAALTGTASGNVAKTDATINVSFSQAGILSAATGAFRWYNDTGSTLQIKTIRASVDTAPSGSSIAIDVNVNGTTIYSTQNNRPIILDSNNTATGGATSTSTISNGSYFTVDIDQVGSTTAGSNLTVQIWLSYA